MVATLNAVRAERIHLKPVNPDATYQRAYQDWEKKHPVSKAASSHDTLPIKATLHGFTLPSAVVVEAAVSPKKVAQQEADMKKPLSRVTKPAALPTTTAGAHPAPTDLAANATNVARFVDLDRLAATVEHRRGRAKVLSTNTANGYTLAELKTLATVLGVSAGGLKADVLTRIMNVVKMTEN